MIAPVWTFFAALLAAAGLDVVANLLVSRSQGFRKLGFGIGSLLTVCLAFTFLAYAVRGLDLAVAYALWGGFGILGTCLGGWLLMGQKLRPVAFLGIAALLGGMALLHFG